MENIINILIINSKKKPYNYIQPTDTLIQSSTIEDSLEILLTEKINIVLIFCKQFIQNHLNEFINFTNYNLNNHTVFHIVLTRKEHDIAFEIEHQKHIYVFDIEYEEKQAFINIKKQIDLIKRTLILEQSQKYYLQLLNENKNTLILHHTLNSIHTLIKENLNLISLKNGKHFLNDILNTSTKKDYNELEYLLLSISNHINTIDTFINGTDKELNTYINHIQPILELYFNAYDLTITSEIQLKNQCLDKHLYLVLNLIFLHILKQNDAPYTQIQLHITAINIDNSHLIKLSITYNYSVEYKDSCNIHLAKNILSQYNQSLNVITHEYGYEFTIALN